MTLENLQKVLAALKLSSPHRTIVDDQWKSLGSAWGIQRLEAIQIVQSEIEEKTPLDLDEPRILLGMAAYNKARNKSFSAMVHAVAVRPTICKLEPKNAI